MAGRADEREGTRGGPATDSLAETVICVHRAAASRENHESRVVSQREVDFLRESQVENKCAHTSSGRKQKPHGVRVPVRIHGVSATEEEPRTQSPKYLN